MRWTQGTHGRGARGLAIAIAGCMGLLGCAGGHEHGAEGHDRHGHTQVPRRVFPDGAGAPLFNDLGDFERPITTESALAQQRVHPRQAVVGHGHQEVVLQVVVDVVRRHEQPGQRTCVGGARVAEHVG